MSRNRTIPIRSEVDVITARMQVRELARGLGMTPGDQAHISLATSSLIHELGLGVTCQGHVTMDCVNIGGRTGVRVVCVERNGAAGDGRTPGSLSDLRWMVDELSIEKLPPDDLQITMIKWLA